MKNVLRVYRVEHKESKNGPFTAGGDIALFLNKVFSTQLDTHPPIFSDIGRLATDTPWAMVCGCQNMSTLRDWFNYPAVVSALIAHGYVIRAFDMEDDSLIYYGKSGRQLMFMREDAIAVTEMPVSRLLKKGKYGG